MKSGDIFGSLTLLAPVLGSVRPTWRCRCSCGLLRDYSERILKSGQIKSCCETREIKPALKHGMSRHPAYLQYHRMVLACKTFTRVERLKNKSPDEFKNKTHENKPKKASLQAVRLRYDLGGNIVEGPAKKPHTSTFERLGYVQRPIPISPEVATWELFWAAMGPDWFEGAKLIRLHQQPLAPDAAADAASAMCLANLRWVPK